MKDYKLRRCKHLMFVFALVDNALMNLSLVTQIGAVLKNTQLKNSARKTVSLILVDVDETADHADDGLLAPFHLLQHRTYLADCLRTEILVGVKKKNPISLGFFQCIILRSGKVVLPWMVKYTRSRRFCHFNRTIGRSRIDNDHLIGELFHRIEPSADIFLFVFHNHAGGELHAPTSFIHAS